MRWVSNSKFPDTTKFSPDFERLKTTLFGGQADCVPLLELGIDPAIMVKIIGREINGVEDIIDFMITAGYDYVKCSPVIDMDPARKKDQAGKLVTRATELDRARIWATGGQGLITTMAEFESYPWPKPEEVSYQQFDQAQLALPANIKIIGQYGDIFTWVWELMGFETFSFALVDNLELVEAMFEKIGRIELDLFNNMLRFDKVGALFYSDDLAYYTGLMCAPAVFRQYLFPWLAQIADLCRSARIPFIYHSDGRLWDVLDDLVELGVNALHPIEPRALDIRQVKKHYGTKLCLIGNVDVDILTRGTPEQVRQIVRNLIRDIGPGGGYCVGSGNSIPHYVNVDNFRALLAATREFGRYPIQDVN